MGEADVIRIDDHARSRTGGRPRCRATTTSGRACRNSAVTGDGYCQVHGGERARAAHPSSAGRAGRDEAGTLDRVLSFLERRMRGDYPIDDFGYDEELAKEVLLKLVRPLYENYFRARTIGIDRIPAEGPALLVGNHSGAIALDAVMMQVAVASKHPQARPVRNVGADLVFRLPFVGHLARKTGTVLACDEDTIELIRRGELVGVFPEGYKGVGKGWGGRYRLQRFGRGGFVELALRTGSPIIPVAVVGAEEIYPKIGDAGAVGRLIGAPFLPITPTFPWLGPLGLIPLPSKWRIEFCEPIETAGYGPDAADDRALVFEDERLAVALVLFAAVEPLLEPAPLVALLAADPVVGEGDLEQRVDALHQRLGNQSAALPLLDRLDPGEMERLFLGKAENPDAHQPFHHHLAPPFREAEDLVDAAKRTDPAELPGMTDFTGPEAGNQAEQVLAAHRLVDHRHGIRLDKKRKDHVREHHLFPHRMDGQNRRYLQGRFEHGPPPMQGFTRIRD